MTTFKTKLPKPFDLPKRIERMDAQRVTTHALSLTTPFVYWATPERGADTADVLRELGYDDDAVALLRREGVV